MARKCVPKSGVKPKVNIQLVHTTNKSIALIQAYIFEGSYYELPKPKIMVVSGTAEPVPGKAGSLVVLAHEQTGSNDRDFG